MIPQQQIEIARANWLKASKELGFKIITPHSLFISGAEKKVFAFLPEYGSSNGAIIELTHAPEYETDKNIAKWAKINNYFCSFLNIDGYLNYNKDFFKETLEDWVKYSSL